MNGADNPEQEQEEFSGPEPIRHSVLSILALFCAFGEDFFEAITNFWRMAGRMLVEHHVYRQGKREVEESEKIVHHDLASILVQE